MITKNSVRKLLEVLGFSQNARDVYVKTYGSLCKTIVVDCSKETITWPEGLTARNDTTSNFSAPENFVVLECVDRLLAKGYHPEHIVLEETWLLGHEQKGGRADICVYEDKEHHSLLLIVECKTAGGEFRKFKKQLFQDGGQLFSYWQQNLNTKWLCLYASDLIEFEKNGEIVQEVSYKDSIIIINCEDDENLLAIAEKDDSILLYKNARFVEELFQTWDETYNKQTCPDVIFGPDTQAYDIGIRPLKKKDLRPFSPDDGIVNRFLEILRHNNVSDRENAFNKLVALFISKLVDETTKEDDDELDFQYRSKEKYEELQDRLQRLYRDGMKEFMEEKIFYVENDYADKLFAQYSGTRRRNAISQLRETIRKLKFYSNNEFAFKDVHNEELFLQNGKILVEVVQLFEQYKIVYAERNQLLGDLFEQLLAKGFKQNEGQFFTAMPIARFIWDSLPLGRSVRRGGKICHPRVIDYACGAGHFLTEAVEAINSYFAVEGGNSSKDNAWVEKSIYGVEKDYRLARVSKVSLHMNGAGRGQIIFGDGLENYPERGIENGKFDILVANPPYSVEAFKSHLKLKNNKLDLLDFVSDQGSEIEALFVERMAQLLKPRGLAAVILPSTILTTGVGPYVEARRELVDNFYLRAIVGLGKNAFQATNTETVILFLEKYDEPPKRASMVADSVEMILSGKPPAEWEDREIFDAYIDHVGVAENEYLDFVSRKKSWTAWKDHAYFGSYCKTFDPSSKSRRSKLLSSAGKDEAVSSRFYDHWIGKVERNKLTVFGLVYRQKTLVVKSPDEKNAERAFLGYTWSDRSGQEGIHEQSPGGQMYNDKDRLASGTIASGIRDAFNEIVPSIEMGTEYVHYLSLRDLFDFSRAKFDMAISLSPHRPVVLPQGMVHLEAICDYVTDRVPFSDITSADYVTTDNMLQKRGGVIPYAGNPVPGKVVKYQKGDILISNIRPYLKKIWFADRDGGCSPDVLVFRSKDAKKALPEYLFACLSSDAFFDYVMEGKSGVKMPRGDKGQILRYPMKKADIGIQRKIVSDFVNVDADCAKSKRVIDGAKGKIDRLVTALLAQGGTKMSLSDDALFDLSIGKRVVDAQLRKDGAVPVMSANVFEPMGMIDAELLSDYSVDSVLWGIDGDWMVNVFKAGRPFYPTDHCGVLRIKTAKLLPFVAAKLLERAGRMVGFKRSNRASIERVAALTITVPHLSEQRKVVAEVGKLEDIVAKAEQQLAASVALKAAILSKYLK